MIPAVYQDETFRIYMAEITSRINFGPEIIGTLSLTSVSSLQTEH